MIRKAKVFTQIQALGNPDRAFFRPRSALPPYHPVFSPCRPLFEPEESRNSEEVPVRAVSGTWRNIAHSTEVTSLASLVSVRPTSVKRVLRSTAVTTHLCNTL